MKALIKRGLIIVPTIALAGVMAAGVTIADSKDDNIGWGVMGGQDSYHGRSHGDNDGHSIDRMTRHMSKALDLTGAQQAAIKDIMKGQRTGDGVANRQVMEMHFSELAQLQSGSDAYTAKAKEIGALQGEAIGQGLIDRANMQTQVMAVLTPEQVEEFQLMRDKMADKRASHMGKHHKKGDH
jgi:Spy/CpxP family protein refolding chaperone